VNDISSQADAAAEAELLAGLQAGDDAAYARLVRTHAGRMLAVARRMLRDEDAAEDVVQDAFISAFKAIDRFKGDSKLSTWLHRIVVNAALMRIRARSRRSESSIEDLLPRFLEDGHHVVSPEEWKHSAHELLEREATRGKVRELIDQLPDDYRTVLVMRDIEELDTRETAELLGITPNAAKIRLHRARLALRELLDPHMRELL
jgi:RNA polymerase sigma-70 factor (ECF subfamily)